jgi:PAS domain S-box-containing protein
MKRLPGNNKHGEKYWFGRVVGLVAVQAIVVSLVVGLGWGWGLVGWNWMILMAVAEGLLLTLTLRDIRQLRNIEKEMEIAKKRAENERERDRVVLSSIGEGIVVLDHESRVSLLNKAAETMIGWTMDDAVGKPWGVVAPLQDEKGNVIDNEKRATKRVMQENIILSNDKNYYVRKDGTRFPVGTTAAPIEIRGKIEGTVAVFRDITHDKAVDRAKSEFVSLASHQLRTPLSAIKWFSEMLLSGDAGKLAQEQDEYVHNIYQSNERMIELVDALLNISRIESGRIIVDPKPTDLGDLVKQLVEDLTGKIKEKKHSLIITIHPQLSVVNVDPKLIRQVYMNLLTNSIKYSPEGGQIEIAVSTKDGKVLSRVTDSGTGIPRDDQSKIFQKFFRAGNAVKMEPDGTGLGLYLAKAIIDSSGGKLWFKSEENKGTTFWFTLPLTGMIPRKGEVSIN